MQIEGSSSKIDTDIGRKKREVQISLEISLDLIMKGYESLLKILVVLRG